MNISPMKDYVVVKRLPPPKSAGGLLLPDSANEKSMLCTVVTDSVYTENPLFVPGDIVLLQKYAGHEIKLDGEDFILVKMTEILAEIEHD